MSSAARCWAFAPLIELKKPPTYKVRLSGETFKERTPPEAGLEGRAKLGAHDVGDPVAASNTAKLVRATSLTPAAAPGGRMALNVPPTNTRPLASATAHAMP